MAANELRDHCDQRLVEALQIIIEKGGSPISQSIKRTRIQQIHRELHYHVNQSVGLFLRLQHINSVLPAAPHEDEEIFMKTYILINKKDLCFLKIRLYFRWLILIAMNARVKDDFDVINLNRQGLDCRNRLRTRKADLAHYCQYNAPYSSSCRSGSSD